MEILIPTLLYRQVGLLIFKMKKKFERQGKPFGLAVLISFIFLISVYVVHALILTSIVWEDGSNVISAEHGSDVYFEAIVSTIPNNMDFSIKLFEDDTPIHTFIEKTNYHYYSYDNTFYITSQIWDMISIPHNYEIKIEAENSNGDTDQASIVLNFNYPNTNPLISDLYQAQNELFRGHGINVYCDASDQEDSLFDLQAIIQYRLPSSTTWVDTDEVFNEDIGFMAVVQTTLDDNQIGEWDFRCLVLDNDGGASEWTTDTNTVLVKNNPPEISPSISNQQTIGTDSFTFDLTNHKDDSEDSGTDLIWSIENQNPEFFEINMFGDIATVTPVSPGDGMVTFTLGDSDDGIDTQIVYITIESNLPPTANDVYVAITQNTQVQIVLDCQDPDDDELYSNFVSLPDHGDLAIENDKLYYTPDSQFYGSDEFDYYCYDGYEYSDDATVFITVSRNINPKPRTTRFVMAMH